MRTLVSFSDKRVVVTGASSGLGAQCALEFARKGAAVVAVARRKSRLVKLEKAIRAAGGSAISVVADLSRCADVRRVCRRIETELGGADILINNAGTYLAGQSLVETDLSQWTELMHTNLRAPYLLCRSLVPGMVSRGYGRIINVTSATKTLEGIGIFRISKIGLEVLSAVLAAELRDTGVTATAFNPGWMKTETSSDGRSPRSVARALVELVKRDSSFPNGNFIDLEWFGRAYSLRRRVPGHGRFGV